MINYREEWFPGQYYHIYNHAIGKDALFRNEDNYRFFLKKYALYIPPIAETFAYCLLTTHFHFLIRIRPELSDTSKVSDSFKRLFTSYAHAYNKAFQRRGTLFEPRLKRKRIDTQEYFLHAVNYIHLNPVAHGAADRPDKWPFSSYAAFFAPQASRLNTQHVLHIFGGLANFQQAHDPKVAAQYAVKMEMLY